MHNETSAHKAAAPATAAALAAAATTAAPGQAAITATVWHVGGLPTEVLELPANGSPEVQLLVIPGNPGASLYYSPFMQSLHRRFGGRARVVCISNLGMDSRGLTAPGAVYSLEQQIEHKVALLRDRLAGPGRPPLVILAHSIGCYMAIHATHRLEHHYEASSHAAAAAVDSVARHEWEHPGAADEAAGSDAVEHAREQLVAARQQQQQEGAGAGAESANGSGLDGGTSSGSSAAMARTGSGSSTGIVKVIGLYPFLQVDEQCRKQSSLRRLTRHHAAVARVAGWARALPLGLKRAIVRLASPDLEPHAVDTTLQVFTNPASVANGLYMGLTEFETLSAPADWWLLRQLGPRFALFVCPGDTWFKVWKWEALHAEVPGVESYWVDTQSHAFCVSAAQSDDLAARIVPIVQAALRPAAAAGATAPVSRL